VEYEVWWLIQVQLSDNRWYQIGEGPFHNRGRRRNGHGIFGQQDRRADPAGRSFAPGTSGLTAKGERHASRFEPWTPAAISPPKGTEMIVTQYNGFHINEHARIVYDEPPAERTFATPLGDLTGHRVPMTDLRKGDRFVGPDDRTPYEVIESIELQIRGWLDVRDLTLDHVWDAAQKCWKDEGFFAYSWPEKVFVYRYEVGPT
jgi:hypothetical protein